MQIERILLPTRPQPDTIVAIFLLQTYGTERFPGIQTARVETRHALPEGTTFEQLLSEGCLAIDVGGGPFDHHNTGACSSELIATYLGISKNPEIAQLLHYAKRDDADGKGTMSDDPIDRAFGLSGLIAALNKTHIDDPHYVVTCILPLISAHHSASLEHHVALPKEIEEKKRNGCYQEYQLRQGDKNLKMVCVVSDKPSMPTFLRSQRGGRADIVVQKMEQSNHMCILTKQDRKVNLSKTIALIRLREAELSGVALTDDMSYLEKTGRTDEVPHWYYDPATNSLLNGGAHNRAVAEPRISWEEMKRIVCAAIPLGSAQ